MARLYTNENFDQRAVRALRALGHDVLTTHEAGKSGQGIPDDDVLRYAAQEDRVLLTINRKDFIKLHKETRGGHSGIVACTQDGDFARLANSIHAELEKEPNPSGKLIRVYRPAS